MAAGGFTVISRTGLPVREDLAFDRFEDSEAFARMNEATPYSFRAVSASDHRIGEARAPLEAALERISAGQ